jgi:Putative zinc-finger
MTICHLWETPDVELYFYEELDAADMARVAAHLRGCAECRQRLDDLRALGRVLARPRVETPPAGDWSGFMRRLDQACGLEADGFVTPKRLGLHRLAAIAAMLTLVTIGLIVASRVGPQTPAPSRAVASVAPPVVPQAVPNAPAPASAAATIASRDRGLVEMSEEHLERSKLVVLGLATRDPERTSPADWQYERQLAGSLLSDTRLYRLAAEDRGMKDLARVMGDLETVLLQTSLSDHADRKSLERVQRLITKRDLMVKMQVVGSAGI